MLNQNKQENKEVKAISNIAKLAVLDFSIFKDNSKVAFLYKKTEKLLAAIYLVSSLIKDTEPLKEQIRSNAICLLKDSFNLSVSQNSSLNITKTIFLNSENFILNSIKITSFLETAFYAGFISEMNFNILKDELLKALQEVEGEGSIATKNSILSDQFFDTKESDFVCLESDKGSHLNSVSNYQSKGHVLSDRNHTPLTSGLAKNNETVIRPSEQKQLVKSNRQDIILSMLKNKSNLGIKDFVSGIKDCSEKTIQRELTTLLSKGQISKTGEKRWSKYSIKI